MTRRNIIYVVLVAVLLVGLIALANWKAIRISYHQWQMISAYNKLFGNPQRAGNGLASHDVTGIDVDSVMKAYETHRNALVELRVLDHVKAHFPNLASDGTRKQSDLRSEFVHRMWETFPGHRHYYLAGDGSFESWIRIDARNDWDYFIGSELARASTDSENEDAP